MAKIGDQIEQEYPIFDEQAYVQSLVEEYSENDYDKAGCIWVANVLATAHEDGASRLGENPAQDRAMDLHNNAIGRAIYDANAWNSQKCGCPIPP